MADDPGATAPAESIPAAAAPATVVEPVTAPAVADAATVAPAVAAPPALLSEAAPASTEAAADPAAVEPAAAAAATEPELGGAAATEAAAEPIDYGDFAFPEGVTADPELVKGATELFAADKLPKERAQAYIDYHNQVLAKLVEHMAGEASANQWKTFNDMVLGWQDETKKQFANNYETTLRAARTAIAHCVDENQRGAFYQLGTDNGFGSHPLVIGAWARAGNFIHEVLAITGKADMAAALKFLREPKALVDGNRNARMGAANGASSPAQRRYAQTSQSPNRTI